MEGIKPRDEERSEYGGVFWMPISQPHARFFSYEHRFVCLFVLSLIYYLSLSCVKWYFLLLSTKIIIKSSQRPLLERTILP